jgi:hypothetical protein
MRADTTASDEFADVEWSSESELYKTNARDALLQADETIRRAFFESLRAVRQSANRHERIQVSWWYFPFIYVEIRDTRWKHYPCYMRLLVSFDLTNGRFASLQSANRYVFARRGWGSFLDRLVGRKVTRYCDCGNPNNVERC